MMNLRVWGCEIAKAKVEVSLDGGASSPRQASSQDADTAPLKMHGRND
jgi:hypothetical protein